MREVRAAVLSLIVADLYPMDLQTSTDFPDAPKVLAEVWQSLRGGMSGLPFLSDLVHAS